MVASAAQINANRLNSLKSCGPKTPEGKEHSRANSLQHGFCSTVVDHPDDPSTLSVAAAESSTSDPANPGFEGWLVGQVTLARLKIERCQAMQEAVRSQVVLRASVTWGEDRLLVAIQLASKLAVRPEEVAAQLRETFDGCDWLRSRWAMLAFAADSQNGIWTPEQTRLAYDLEGTPREFRDGHPPGTTLDFAGLLVEPTPAPAIVARRAIDKLNERLEILRPIEEAACDRAKADLSDDAPELRRLRRYEAELHRRMKWALGQLPEPQAQSAESSPTPEVEAVPDPEPTSDPQPSNPAPPAPAPRVEQRLGKAGSRREAKRRKLERLRA